MKPRRKRSMVFARKSSLSSLSPIDFSMEQDSLLFSSFKLGREGRVFVAGRFFLLFTDYLSYFFSLDPSNRVPLFPFFRSCRPRRPNSDYVSELRHRFEKLSYRCRVDVVSNGTFYFSSFTSAFPVASSAVGLDIKTTFSYRFLLFYFK